MRSFARKIRPERQVRGEQDDPFCVRSKQDFSIRFLTIELEKKFVRFSGRSVHRYQAAGSVLARKVRFEGCIHLGWPPLEEASLEPSRRVRGPLDERSCRFSL